MPRRVESFVRRVVRDDRVAAVLLALLLVFLQSVPAAAQDVTSADAKGPLATRESLLERAAAAESIATAPDTPAATREYQRGEAWVLRQRLQNGDFAVGDRILITVAGEPGLGDTVTVRNGAVVVLGELPPISVAGVLRSELEGHLRVELARYIREPQVTALSLLRVAVFGQVGRPGFYHVPADLLLSDMLMRAGGPAPTADLKRSVVRRGGDPIYNPDDVQIALADGFSLDFLNLRSGDEFFVEERRRMNWMSVLQGVTVLSGLLTLALSLGS